MPITFQEIASWTVDDVNAQILKILPKGWVFDLKTQPDSWRAAYRSETGVEIWVETHFELRLLLLSAFGWLYQRLNPSRSHPAWRVTEPRVLVPVRQGPGETTPDPQSLNPEYVRSVYAAHARKRGKENG